MVRLNAWGCVRGGGREVSESRVFVMRSHGLFTSTATLHTATRACCLFILFSGGPTSAAVWCSPRLRKAIQAMVEKEERMEAASWRMEAATLSAASTAAHLEWAARACSLQCWGRHVHADT